MDNTQYDIGYPIKVRGILINDTVWWDGDVHRLVGKCEGPPNWYVLKFEDGINTELGGNETLARAVRRVDPDPFATATEVIASMRETEAQRKELKAIRSLLKDQEVRASNLERQIRKQDQVIRHLTDELDLVRNDRDSLQETIRSISRLLS